MHSSKAVKDCRKRAADAFRRATDADCGWLNRREKPEVDAIKHRCSFVARFRPAVLVLSLQLPGLVAGL